MLWIYSAGIHNTHTNTPAHTHTPGSIPRASVEQYYTVESSVATKMARKRQLTMQEIQTVITRINVGLSYTNLQTKSQCQ